AVDVSDSQKADEYLDFYAMIRRGAGIRAAFSYALSASDGHDSVVWRAETNGKATIAEAIGARIF
ncbi:MAG: hypothetical protein PVI78_08500, partial [Anaerolineales bacterium]